MNKFLLVLVLSLSLLGCNTFAGFGRDVEKLGEKIEDGVGNVGKGVNKLGEKIESKAEEKKSY